MPSLNNYAIKAAALSVITVSVLVLLGWQFDIVYLKQMLPTSVAMNPMSAFAFLFSGFSFLFLFQKPGYLYQRKVAIGLATLVLLIVTLQLLTVLKFFDSGIDRFLYAEKINKSLYHGMPNRMAPNTAVAFFLAATALLFLAAKRIIVTQYLALLVSVIALVSMIGYSYDTNIFYGVSSFLPMAFNTGLCFFILSVAVLFSHDKRGFMAEITSPNAGGKAARVLLPASIAIPFMLGFFILDAASKGYYSIIVGISLLVTAIIFIFVFLVWVTARSINKFEIAIIEEKKSSNEKLKRAAEYSFDLYNNAPCGYHTVNVDGYIDDINETELKWLGYLRQEVVGKLSFFDIVTQESQTSFTTYSILLQKNGAAKDLFLEFMRKDGTVFPVLISAIAILDTNGKIHQSRVTVIDYTERKIQDEKIRRFNLDLEKQVLEQTQLVIDKEQKYRFLLQNMREGILILNFDWHCLFVNTSLISQSRLYREEKLLGYTLLEIFPGIEHTALFNILDACMQSRIQEIFETEIEFPDGGKGWFKLSVQPVPEGLFILVTDITEQKKAETEFQQSQLKYASLMNSVEGIVWEADPKTFEFSFVSQQAERLLGYPLGRWVNESTFWADHIHEEDREWAVNYCAQCTLEKRAHQFEYRMIAADGSIIWLRDIVSLEMENDEPVKLSGIMVDITERKKMEEDLASKMLLKQKLITEVTILAQEKERNELGQELHDNVNQILSVVKLYLGMAKSDKETEKDLVEQGYQYLEQAMNEIRKLSHSLVAPSLGNIGLKEALQELVETISKPSSINIKLIVEDDYHVQTVDKNKELMIYRIVQEQLNNVIKYAEASNVHIFLKQQSRKLYVSIIDDGVGFDIHQTGKGIGLKNINSRVNFYSGNMNVITAPGQGCTLEVTIPN